LRIVGDGATLLQDVFADRETDSLLLLIANEREMSIEKVMGGVALVRLRELDNVDEHVGEGIAGHRAVSSALQLNVEA
jgi:hypothetical protein